MYEIGKVDHSLQKYIMTYICMNFWWALINWLSDYLLEYAHINVSAISGNSYKEPLLVRGFERKPFTVLWNLLISLFQLVVSVKSTHHVYLQNMAIFSRFENKYDKVEFHGRLMKRRVMTLWFCEICISVCSNVGMGERKQNTMYVCMYVFAFFYFFCIVSL